MKKDNAQKLGSFETRSLESLKQDIGAYIPGIVKDQNNYKIPAADFMHKVYHDDTLVGDGTPYYPLSVVGASGSGSSGSSGSNVFIDSPANTILVTENPSKHFHLEGTNWGYRYNFSWDDSAPIETLYNVDGNIETEIIHELGDPALKFVMQNTSDVITKFYVMTAADDYYGLELAQFTGDFIYQFNPASIGDYYSLNIETTNLPPSLNKSVTYNDNELIYNGSNIEYTSQANDNTTNNIVDNSTYQIDIFSGNAITGSEPEEMMLANDLTIVNLDDFIGVYTVN